MKKGEVCHYKLNSTSGGPGFRLDDLSTVDRQKFNITYVEYNK